jgi:acyl-coenzyme A synthetase/AMP-(fatty) acid ligase
MRGNIRRSRPCTAFREIAARLAEHPFVREAVVVAHEGPAGDKHLVAYVVVDAEHALKAEGLTWPAPCART